MITSLFVATQIEGQDETLRTTGELRRACSRRGAAKPPPGRINTSDRLKALRRVMQMDTIIQTISIDAYIITSDDEHQTEYVAPYDRRREYISGFSGSSGDAIVTLNKAALWTDGRYHLQADNQLNCDWLLMREGQSKIPTKSDWLKNELANGSRIGADPKLMSASAWNSLKYELDNSTLHLVPVHVNLIDLIWKNHADTIADKDAFVWEFEYSGKNWTTKVEETRNELRNMGVQAMVITSLAEIAWLLNIRGRDIPYNPFVKSYVLLSLHEVRLYVDRSKLVKNDVNKHLRTDWGVSTTSITVQNYEDIWIDLPTYLQAWNTILLPSSSPFSMGVSQAIYSLVPEKKRLYKPSPIIHLKAMKNPVEIAGMEVAHIRDAAAMCEFLDYLETRIGEGDMWSELDVAKIINNIRFEQNFSLGNSFETIVAFGSNGALPHYEPTPATNSLIFTNSTLVVDSGGQYYDGTTDVTRTLHFGTPTKEQINAYTRVLMGSIQLSSLVFPPNMKSSVADVMARAPLWEVGLDYMHGTGHGIGTFLGVHESPISMHYNSRSKDQHLKAGYFLSNEPGFYSEGEFGVRLENILEVIPKPWLLHYTGQSFLGFKDVTLVPYEPKLIDTALLSVHHKRWLNEYNTRIRELVGKELKEKNKMSAFYWMMEKTKHIPGAATSLSYQPVILTTAILFIHFLN